MDIVAIHILAECQRLNNNFFHTHIHTYATKLRMSGVVKMIITKKNSIVNEIIILTSICFGYEAIPKFYNSQLLYNSQLVIGEFESKELFS